MAMQWYVIHAYSGYEERVKTDIEQRFKHLGYEDKLSQIIIPTEDVFEHKKGHRQITTRKFFPGYIMVEMEMSDETWYVVKNTPKVTGFVGVDSKPTPMPPEDIEKVQEQMRSGHEKPRPDVLFERGERVKITDGPFASFTGRVDDVNEDKEKLHILVSIFGRSTPVELSFYQVKKI